MQRIRKELGILLNAKVILSVGKVNKNKNHKIGIEVFAKLRDKNKYCVICGHGPLMEACKELVQVWVWVKESFLLNIEQMWLISIR